MDGTFGIDLLKLAELLKPPEEENQPDDDLPKAGYQIEKPQAQNLKVDREKIPKSIEEYEIQEEKEISETLFDSRKEPSYDIKYRQAVTPEDVFLQMGAKSPATASCEDMILGVNLPGEIFTALELEVTKTEIKLTGYLHRLMLTLPQPIDPDLSNASWNQEEEKLTLTLRMTRELDFINF